MKAPTKRHIITALAESAIEMLNDYRDALQGFHFDTENQHEGEFEDCTKFNCVRGKRILMQMQDALNLATTS